MDKSYVNYSMPCTYVQLFLLLLILKIFCYRNEPSCVCYLSVYVVVVTGDGIDKSDM